MPPSVIFGVAGIGHTEKSYAHHFTTPEHVCSLLEELKSLDLLVLDSAASYPPGNPGHTETLLGQAHVAEKGFIIDSKIEVHAGNKLDEETIPRSLKKTLELLGTDKVRTIYAHAPDKNTPVETTIKGFVGVVEAGLAERWAICNYDAEQLQELLDVCDEKGYLKPTIYQCLYNALSRGMEKDVIPICRKYGISFYAYSPLAGGFLTGKVTFKADNPGALYRTRWEGETILKHYLNQYDKPEMHEAVRHVTKVGSEEGVSVTEASLRWLLHHSALVDGDAIIMGGTKIPQIQSNVKMCRNGPLSEKLLAAVEEMANIIKPPPAA